MDEFSAAQAFIRRRIGIQGNLYTAIRYFRRPRPRLATLGPSLLAHLREYVDDLRSSQEADYPPGAFFREFLDSRMLYSAAYFGQPEWSLEDAQFEKLDRVCRLLELKPNDRFLHLECGWGALLIYAAEHFGAQATGCTSNREQAEIARSAVRSFCLDWCVTVQEIRWQDMQGRFDKIASIGMFQGGGQRHLLACLRKIHGLLRAGGLCLYRAIVRPACARETPVMAYSQPKLLGRARLVQLADIVHAAERLGFDVVRAENLRRNYELTCRAWVERLLSNSENCRRLVPDATYRRWLLDFAASVVSFEDGLLDGVQVTLRKPSAG